MAELLTIPFAPIRLVDVRDTLKAHGGDVSNEMSSFFTSDANINKWSWHKPLDIIDENIIPYDWSAKAAEVDNGFDVSNTADAVENFRDLCHRAESGDLTWPYDDEEFSPMRIADFGGYEPLATNPFALSTVVYRSDNNYYLRVAMGGANLQEMAATWASLSDYVGCGVALWKGNEFHYYHCGPLNEFSDVPLSSLSSGEWHCILCLDTELRQAGWMNENFYVLAMPVEHVSQDEYNELATFEISGGGPPTPPPPTYIDVRGSYEYMATVLSDGNVIINLSSLLFEFENHSGSDISTYVNFYARKLGGTITQTIPLYVGNDETGEITLSDLGEDEWGEWILPIGDGEPVITASYSYLGNSYSLELHGTQI